MERRKKKKESSGFYVAVCCCAVVIAIIGYANRTSDEEHIPEEKVIKKAEILDESESIGVKTAPSKQEPEETDKPTDEAKEQVAVNKTVEVEEEIKFHPPVEGNVIEEYSGDDLVYNEALKDWRAHSGVDFSAEVGEQVLCSAKGVVEEVFDSSLGRCVIVDHKNGFKTMYANLNEDTNVKAGDEVSAGGVIGTVGNTALGDSTDEPHVHFEMIKKDKNVNPTDYLE